MAVLYFIPSATDQRAMLDKNTDFFFVRMKSIKVTAARLVIVTAAMSM